MRTFIILLCLIIISAMIFGAVLLLARKISAANANRPDREGWRLCVLGAVICLVISIASGAYTCFFLSQSRAATATVIRLVEYKNNDNESALSPVYEYDVDGVRYEDRPTGSDGRHFSVGDQVPIRYHQNRPHESRIDYWGHRWGVPVFMLCAAIVLAAWAVVLRIGNHRREGQ